MSAAAAATPSLILASASPRRRELLSALGVDFEVVVADVTEHEDERLDPRVMVARNAALKADAVAARHPGRWVLGADTTVFCDGLALNKPADVAAARAMLRRLAGRAHTVFTGVALRHGTNGVCADHGAETRVIFRAFGDEVIERYLAAVPVLDKAGAYAIQDHGEWLVEQIEGELSNVIGLPQALVKGLLQRYGLLR
jgi:septum formation protein